MSKKVINIDAMPELNEAIELTIGGQTYVIPDLGPETLNKVADLADEEADGATLHSILARQLALLTDAPVENFNTLDARKLSAAVQRVMQCITEAGLRNNRRQRR